MWLFPVYSHTTGAVTGSDASVYLCTNDHESASATYPTTGASYANDWVVTTQISTGGAWVTATNYYSGHIRCTKTQRLQDFDASANNPDFHVRAYNALVMGLAASLAPEYLTINEAKFWIVLAKEAKERFMLSQTEHGPIYVKPRFK